mmetsp:Transcript_37036/g.32739  ORF Transcript_37036/g.32739 Transcript_37036/m.32739 type:complete len:100 (-) Transcript_37036:137-436(-)
MSKKGKKKQFTSVALDWGDNEESSLPTVAAAIPQRRSYGAGGFNRGYGSRRDDNKPEFDDSAGWRRGPSSSQSSGGGGSGSGSAQEQEKGSNKGKARRK